MTDVSGAVPPTPSQQFITLIKAGWAHSPKTKEEALALYHYVMRSQVEPTISALVLAVIADLPEAEAAIVRAALVGAEIALAKCRCW
jgi:hypothetical protein